MEYLVSRLVSSFFVGTILSQTGSLIQFSTRNLLASPSTLGFDGLSVLWILVCHSLLIFMNMDESIGILFVLGVPTFVMVGIFFSSLMIRHKNIEKLIFMGLTFNLLVGAVFSLWQFLFIAFNLSFPTELWFGHFRFSDMNGVVILMTVEALVLAGWLALKNDFALLSLGDLASRNLSLNFNKLYPFIFISISVGTFVVINLFGAFSFMGLIFPILARKLWFKHFDLTGELVFGAACNGILLMGIDLLCYYFPIYGAEVPVGLIVTAVGAVSLILILWKSDNRLEILANRIK